MNKALKWSSLAAVAVGVFVLLGFVDGRRSAAPCDRVDVVIGTVENGMVTESDVRQTILNGMGELVGLPLRTINTARVESLLVDVPYVAHASVYKTIDKTLSIEVTPRQPIVRLIDRKGQSALVDTRGCLMPISRQFPVRLPVVSGAYTLSEQSVRDCQALTDSSDAVLRKIVEFANTINADPFWKAQLQQTVVTDEGDFVSVARVGGHRINFGPGTGLKKKLNALRQLYDKGFNASNWNKYGSINLKYENQIVCTEK